MRERDLTHGILHSHGHINGGLGYLTIFRWPHSYSCSHATGSGSTVGPSMPRTSSKLGRSSSSKLRLGPVLVVLLKPALEGLTLGT